MELALFFFFISSILAILPLLNHLPFFFQTTIPDFLKYAERIYVFDRKGRLVNDQDMIERAYRTTRVWEFLYTRPILKATRQDINFYKNLYELNVKLSQIERHSPQNQKESKIYTVSKELTNSDLALSESLYNFSQYVNKVFETSHRLSHKPSYNTIKKLDEELNITYNRIPKISEILENREILWKQYENAIKDYWNAKYRPPEVITSLISDLLSVIFSFSFVSSVLSFLKLFSYHVYNHYFGLGSIKRARKKYENVARTITWFKTTKMDAGVPVKKFVSSL